ncbi:MAG: hypothetical protein K2K41_07650 [Ruminiclostridium sp.]|nr:hypothetical protein [Ruminiclostridium sp.]
MKKSEKLSKAISDLNEEIIEKADRRRTAEKTKKARKFPLRIISATAACLAAVIGITALFPQSISAQALAEADYPKATKYPGELGINYEQWAEERRARWDSGELISNSVSDFYKKTAEEFLSGNENRAYSPVNIYMALAMLGETTDGESRQQILELLGAGNINELREDAKNMWLANYCNDGAVTSILANSVWLNEDVNIRQQTVDVLAENYYASSYSGDVASRKMTNAVREWLDRQTNGFLSNAVKNVELNPETVMALYSTVYFRAKWDKQFSKSKNDTKTFHTPKVDIQTEFMNNTNNWGLFYAGEDFGAIYLDFKEGGKMWFILPDEDKTIDDVLRSGEYVEMISDPREWESKKNLKIHYSVPKFDISSQIGLAEGLKDLGVTDVFNIKKADFSPLTDSDVFISEANHAARVVIDEEGCTAAAFTELIASGSALPPEDEMDFIVDRPFIFAVMSDTDQPLFIGTVNDPR